MKSYGKFLQAVYSLIVLVGVPLCVRCAPLQLENTVFRLAVLDDGSIRLTDKLHQSEYGPDPWGEGAGTLALVRGHGEQRRTETLSLSGADEIRRRTGGDSADMVFAWKQGISVHTRLSLSGDAFKIRVEEVILPADTRLDRLVYPSRFAPLRTGEPGYLILPARGGAIIPSHIYTRIGGEFWRMDDAYSQLNPQGLFLSYFGPLSFNFFGVQKGASGLTFICDTAYDAGALVFANTRGNRYAYRNDRWSMADPIAAVSSVWRASLGQLRYPRQLTIRAHGAGGYVESARIYRHWLEEQGWSRTLKDKIKQNPERERLIGSTHIDIYGGYPHYTPQAPECVDFSFDQVTAIIDSLHRELKVDRASITVWGTFENYPPNSMPINQRRGGPAAWKKAVDEAKKAGYLISGYHSYMPQEEHDPRFNPRLSFQTDSDDPDLVKRLINTYRFDRTCTSLSLDYAKANLPAELKAAGQNGDFTDAMGFPEGMECYDTRHHRHSVPMTREQDKANRAATFGYIHDVLNLPNWIENGGAPELKMVDAFHGTAEMDPTTGNSQYADIAVAVPLAALVAHDLVVLRPHPEQSYRDDRGQFYKRALLNLVQGLPPIHCFQVWEYEGRKTDIAAFHRLLAKVHRQIGLAEMVNHEFLPGPTIYDTANFLVQKSAFSDGTEIYINLGLDPFRGPRIYLAPYGFEVRLAGGEVLKGSVRYDLDLH